MATWISFAVGLVGLATILVKYFLSNDAKKDAEEEARKKAEAEKQQKIDDKIKDDIAAKPKQSEGAGSAWDAADQ